MQVLLAKTLSQLDTLKSVEEPVEAWKQEGSSCLGP